MKEIDILKEKLYGENSLKISNISIFPGEKSNVTKTEIISEIIKVLDQLESGDLEVIELED